MNTLQTAGIIGAGVGFAKGVIDQKNAKKYDPQASNSVGAYLNNGIRNAVGLGLMGVGGTAIVQHLNGKTVEEIAGQIAGSSYKSKIFPGKEALKEEMTAGAEQYLINKNIKEAVMEEIGNTGAEPKVQAQLAKALSKGNYSDDAFKTAGKILADNEMNPAGADVLKGIAQEARNKEVDTAGMKLYEKAYQYPKAYFSNPDKDIRQARINTAVAGYAGLAIGGRYMQGGSLTRDQYGNRDIAGVPFI